MHKAALMTASLSIDTFKVFIVQLVILSSIFSKYLILNRVKKDSEPVGFWEVRVNLWKDIH